MITVLLVHELAAPDCQVLVGLCGDHTDLLKRTTWARIDELVGFSSCMDCEACALIVGQAPSEPAPLASEGLWTRLRRPPASARRRTSEQVFP